MAFIFLLVISIRNFTSVDFNTYDEGEVLRFNKTLWLVFHLLTFSTHHYDNEVAVSILASSFWLLLSHFSCSCIYLLWGKNTASESDNHYLASLILHRGGYWEMGCEEEPWQEKRFGSEVEKYKYDNASIFASYAKEERKKIDGCFRAAGGKAISYFLCSMCGRSRPCRRRRRETCYRPDVPGDVDRGGEGCCG